MPFSRRILLAAGSSGLLFPALLRGETAPFEEYTPASLKSIERGNNWLMKTFNRDGGCGVDIGTPSDVSCSAVVGLSLLAQGSTPVEGPHSREVRRLRSYLLAVVENDHIDTSLHTQVKADFGGHADYFFACLFLGQVLGEGKDSENEQVRRAVVKLVEIIARAQHPSGHWGNSGRMPNLGVVSAWCALRGAYFAGLHIPASSETTANYLMKQLENNLRSENSRDIFTDAAGMRVLYAVGKENEPIAQKALLRMFTYLEHDYRSFGRMGGEQYLSFQLINDTILKMGGETWERWFPLVRQRILDAQNADGSWTGYSCITSRTFCTACSLTTLTSPNRFLPIAQP